MRKHFLVTLLAVASFPLAAQQQPQQPGTANNDKAASAKQKDDKAAVEKELQERIRVDGAAGGTHPVPPEERKAIGAGAGPHLHDTAPSPQKLPRDRPVEPPK
jgi:hypothetical protein